MISLIWAQDEAGGIGKDNGLPWPRIPEDMKHFKNATDGSTLVMGRKTFDSLGRNLKDREHVVISRDLPAFWNNPRSTGVSAYSSLTDALLYAYKRGRAFVIGGAEVYKQAFPYASHLSVTYVKGTYEADTFWNPDLYGWTLLMSTPVTRNGQEICTINEYIKSPEKLF